MALLSFPILTDSLPENGEEENCNFTVRNLKNTNKLIVTDGIKQIPHIL